MVVVNNVIMALQFNIKYLIEFKSSLNKLCFLANT